MKFVIQFYLLLCMFENFIKFKSEVEILIGSYIHMCVCIYNIHLYLLI